MATLNTRRTCLPRWLLPAALALSASTARAQFMPIYERLRQAESEHFVYICQESLEHLLPNLVKTCEDAYAILTPVFKWTPKDKTYILLSDAWDEHNGMATVYPRPIIVVYAAGVSPGSSIYEPGNFIRSTLFHEYAHILPADAQYGADAVLSSVFGRVQPAVGDLFSTLLALFSAPPGALAPDWYLEGLSIWAETEFVGPGRGRNGVADMVMRMSVADDRVLWPAQWNLMLPEWPFGDAAYLYGMRTIQYAQESQNSFMQERNVPGELADSVAHSCAYNFDSRAIPATGVTFAQLADNVMATERDKQSARIAQLKSKPLTEVTKLTRDRLQVSQPKFGPDGQSIFFSGSGEAERDTLFRYDLASGQVAKLDAARVQAGISRLALLRAGQAVPADRSPIYYTRLNVVGRDRIWSELREYDLRRNSTRTITGTGRYRFPAISPDGSKLAAVRNEAGRYALVEVPLAEAGQRARETVRAEAPEFCYLVDPAYSPDGTSLVYTLARREGSQIHSIDLASGKDKTLLDFPCIILTPTFHPSGKELVFSADRNGVYNLYRMKPEPGAEPEPITHVLGGVFEPDFSPDGTKLAAATYDSLGYHLGILDYAALKPIEGGLPVIDHGWKSAAANQERVNATMKQPAPPAPASRPYHSLAGTRFDYWTPWLTASGDGAQGGVAASFSDPTGYQSLFALGGYDTDIEVPVGVLVYQYAGLYPIFTAYGTYGPDSYYDLIEDTDGVFYDYEEEISVAGAAVTIPWETVDRQVQLTLGYQYTDREAIDESTEDYAGKTLLVTNLFEGSEGAVFAHLEYFNGTAFGRSHSIEQGRYLSAAVEQSDPGLGGDLSRTRALGWWNEYIPVPLGENHVLKLEAIYGTSSGDEIAQGAFGLGGYGSIQADTTPGLPRNIALRGYDDNWQVGTEIVKAGVSYRFPILHFYEGASATLPIYFQQVFGELFYEGGQATGGDLPGRKENDWISTMGMEINLSTTLLRLIDIAPGLGVAYAFDREPRERSGDEDLPEEEDTTDDKLQVYISIKASVNF